MNRRTQKKMQDKILAKISRLKKNREENHRRKEIQAARVGQSNVFRRFCRNRLAILGTILFVALAIIGFSADLFFDYEKDAIFNNMAIRYMHPCTEHIFGTDEFGRDILVRIIYGARISLFVGLGSVSIALSVGALIGATAAYYGGKVDNILMRIMDIFLAIPSSLLAICVVAAMGTGTLKMIIALGIADIPRFSRIVRSAVMSCKGQEYIEAAKACGTRDRRIIFRHILPNAMGPIIVQTTTNMARCVLTISSLSFIGLGIAAPTPEWGSMLSGGRSMMRYHPHVVIFPGVAIMLAALSLYSIGDGLRDALDPRLKN